MTTPCRVLEPADVRPYFHMRRGQVVEILTLTDEQALDMLTHGWDTYDKNLRLVEDGLS